MNNLYIASVLIFAYMVGKIVTKMEFKGFLIVPGMAFGLYIIYHFVPSLIKKIPVVDPFFPAAIGTCTVCAAVLYFYLLQDRIKNGWLKALIAFLLGILASFMIVHFC